MRSNIEPPTRGFAILASAVAATVSAIWGYESLACRGLVAGAISAAMRTAFNVFVHMPTLVLCLGLFAAFAAITHLLARIPIFRQREELLVLALPTACFFGGIGVGRLMGSGLECALHPWA